MGNFDDFDLELKKVAEAGITRDAQNSFNSTSSLTTVICSITGEITEHLCTKPSVETWTTGMSSQCCKGGGGNAAPKCL